MMGSDGKQRLVEPLTEREQEVLQLLAQGMSNRELADELVLSMHTVKWYNRQIYGKLGVENRQEAVAQAREMGLLAGETQSGPPHNLPLQLSSFIGRKSELAEVNRLLSTSRLVTLKGAGGCGKTRLALRAAHSVAADFSDGVWLVELAPLSNATLVPQAVADVFDVREFEDRPLLSLLQSYLHRSELLLLLDNCEHVVEAAAQLAETLLSHCPQLQILATSREALGVTGETDWRVPTLSLPEAGEAKSLDTLKQSDAVHLFVERATTALSDFRLTDENAAAVEQVCRRLDGIPLAIELAAARVKLLRVEQIADRMDDRFQLLTDGSRTALPRHQTLEALIDWSYVLLAPAEQRLLRRVSVFAGGFTLEAVEAVCAADDGDVLELLAQLVNKSLVVVEREMGQEARYRLLETIRQYALDKLEEAGEVGPARDEHLAFFLQLAELAESKLQSGEQLVWLDRLQAEHGNLRAALAWSLEKQNGEQESGLRLTTALVRFWIIRSHLWEGRRWLDGMLTRRKSHPADIRARLVLSAGWLWFEHGQSDPTALLQESLALYRQLNDKAGIASSLRLLGFCALRFNRDMAAATSRFSESLTLAREIDDKPQLASLYIARAYLAMEKGDHDQVTKLAARGLNLAREMGDRQVKLVMLIFLGRSTGQQREYAQATAFLQEALALSRELKNRLDEARVLGALGLVARVQRAYEQAAYFYRESLCLFLELDVSGGVAFVLTNLALVALATGDEAQATSLFRESMALAQEMKDKTLSWWNVWGLARVALAKGDTRRAAQLLSAVAIDLACEHPVDQDDYEREVTLARAELGEEAFAAMAEGEAMSLEVAVALAVEI